MIKITKYTERYKDDVINLIVAIWEKEFDYKGVERPDIYDIPGFYQKDKNSNFWVALSDNEFVGCVGIIKKSDGSAHLKRMAVKKEFRKQGTGEKLFQTVLEFAKKHKINTIYVGTVTENTEAIKFYKNHGFKENEFVPEGLVVADNPICLKLNL